jgi:FkbM family methyltransferase
MSNKPNKTDSFLNHIKMKFMHKLFYKLLKLNISNEKIHGYKVNFFDYSTFFYLYREIFINKQYYFISERDNPLIIDCGSNVGIALIFFKILYPNSKIIAFEPDIETFKILKMNVERNNLEDVELFNKAISNTEGMIDFYIDPNHPGSLIMSTKKERKNKVCNKVHSILLSNYIKENVDFLKMDIEGAEAAVIEELSSKNKLKLIKQMVIEYHHHLIPNEDIFSNTLKILEENGFGYQICAPIRSPFNKGEFQDILIYAYQK